MVATQTWSFSNKQNPAAFLLEAILGSLVAWAMLGGSKVKETCVNISYSSWSKGYRRRRERVGE